MAVTPTTFKVRFPEFASETDARIQLFLDDAVLILNEAYWDVKYDLGVNYYTAHKLALANKTEASGGSGSSGGGGRVSGKAVDGVSISYAVFTPDDGTEAYFAQTAYGREYWALMKSLPIPAFSV